MMTSGGNNLNSTNQKQQRQFGFLIGGLFILLSFSAFRHGRPVGGVLWGLSGISLGTVAMIRPMILSPFYELWMKIGKFLGLINSWIILSLFFFLILTPIGWLMKIFKKSNSQFIFNKNLNSYWIPKEAADLPVDLKEQMRHTF